MVQEKVAILGIDALNFRVLSPLISDGTLPNFKRLTERSAHSRMESIIPSVTGPAWTTINTGKNPGRHGIFDFVRIEDGRSIVNTASDIDSETFMETLSRLGRRCSVIGVPYTYPPGKWFRGIAISDFLYPEVEVHPSEKKAYIDGYRAIANVKDLEGTDLVEDLVRLTKGQSGIGRRMFSEEEWDLFYCYLPGLDTFFHNFYDHIGQDTAEWSGGRELLKEMDSFLGFLMDNIGDGHLLVISDHGFKMYPKTVYLNRVLEREGLMVRSYALSKGSERRSTGIGASIARFVKLPFVFPIARFIYRAYLRVAGGGRGQVKPSLEEGIDYAGSSCYTPTTESMGVYITGTGRERRGEIVSFLSGLEHDGMRVFDRVTPREDMYHGPHVGSAPDLLLRSEDFMISANIYGKELFGEGTAYHDMDAAFFLFGKGIRPGELATPPRLVDVAPTVLRLFGIKGAVDMDGKAIEEAFIEAPKEGSSEMDRIRMAALKFKGKGLNRGSQAPGAAP